MAIANASIAYSGQGPTGTLQQLAFGGKSNAELVLVGTVTFVGDGAASTAVMNYIDGTAALNFTPSGFLFSRCGGTAAATITATNMVDSAAGNTAANVALSAAPAGAATVILAVAVLR